LAMKSDLNLLQSMTLSTSRHVMPPSTFVTSHHTLGRCIASTLRR
jgi:hypothetical protein